VLVTDLLVDHDAFTARTFGVVNVPNGVCWTKDGFLIVVEHNRVLNFPAAEFFYEGPDVAVIEVVPQGKLIPVDEESYNHGARVCRVGKDGMLYIALGQPQLEAGEPLLEDGVPARHGPRRDRAGRGAVLDHAGRYRRAVERTGRE